MTRPADKWSLQQAWQWYASAGVVKGVNFLPSTAVNTTDFWQAETFDEPTIARELAWAARLGYNALRVFLQYLVWEADPSGFLQRLERFLQLAHSCGLRTLLVLFDDCAFSGLQPYLGPQRPPVPGVHNSAWTPSPGRRRVLERSCWPALEEYVHSLLSTFADDERLLGWDLYNEPGNGGMGETSLPLVEAAFEWARAIAPSQPLTCAPWENFESPFSRRLVELSDVVTFHAYDASPALLHKLDLLNKTQRPLLCTECLLRQHGNTFAAFLPLFAARRIGWFNWGLVAGRTQTFLHWESRPDAPKAHPWQHDMLHPDGTPYDEAEIDLIKRFDFTSDPS